MVVIRWLKFIFVKDLKHLVAFIFLAPFINIEFSCNETQVFSWLILLIRVKMYSLDYELFSKSQTMKSKSVKSLTFFFGDKSKFELVKLIYFFKS